MKARTPKDEAIMTIIREWGKSTDKEISLMIGWSAHTIQAWAKELRKRGVKLENRRIKRFDWDKFKK